MFLGEKREIKKHIPTYMYGYMPYIEISTFMGCCRCGLAWYQVGGLLLLYGACMCAFLIWSALGVSATYPL